MKKTIYSADTLINSKGKYLMCHATKPDGSIGFFDKRWGIPKGRVDSAESAYEAAIRETLEETSIDLIALDFIPKKEIYKSLKYNSYDDKRNKVYKVLDVFMVEDELGILQKESLSCSTFVPKLNIPEIDQYYWSTPSQAKSMCFKSLRTLFNV